MKEKDFVSEDSPKPGDSLFYKLFLIENMDDIVGDPIFVFALTVFLFIVGIWITYVISQRPKCKDKKCEELYIDDSKISKMQLFSCNVDLGTRLFFFRKIKLLDVAVSSRVKISYVPYGGVEKELSKEYYNDHPIRNKTSKPVKLTNIKFLKKNEIDNLKVIVQTPFEREKYERKIRREINQNVLKIWNENSEEIRNFKLLLNRPVKIKKIKVIKGTIDSIDLEVAYSSISSVISKTIGSVTSDVSISIILDLPARKIDVDEFIEIQLD